MEETRKRMDGDQDSRKSWEATRPRLFNPSTQPEDGRLRRITVKGQGWKRGGDAGSGHEMIERQLR